jgi:ATP-dependent exoDNAse (exonuclease V) beta subunit
MELRAVRRTTAEIEEERRLLYVAMTRAKHDLQALFHAPAERARRQACLCVADALRPEWHSLYLFAVGTWPVASAQAAARTEPRRPRGLERTHARDVAVRYNRYTVYTGS